MAKVDFKLNLPGLNELMKSAEMKNILNDAAEQIAATANSMASPNIKGADEGYVAVPAKDIRFVAVAEVKATNFAARLDNSRHNTIEKAVRSVKI